MTEVYNHFRFLSVKVLFTLSILSFSVFLGVVRIGYKRALSERKICPFCGVLSILKAGNLNLP